MIRSDLRLRPNETGPMISLRTAARVRTAATVRTAARVRKMKLFDWNRFRAGMGLDLRSGRPPDQVRTRIPGQVRVARRGLHLRHGGGPGLQVGLG